MIASLRRTAARGERELGAADCHRKRAAEVTIGGEANERHAEGPGGTTIVSNPDLDYVTSVLAGFTQSKTSSAWCGGGQTWTAPVVPSEECGSSGTFAQGSNVQVSATGVVYVAYEYFSSSSREIRLTKSTKHGKTFGKFVKVSDVTPIGDGAFCRAVSALTNFRKWPLIARGGRHAVLYISRGQRATIQSLIFSSGVGTYSYADVVVSKSTDGGDSLNKPEVVSPTPGDYAGTGRDQFFPGIGRRQGRGSGSLLLRPQSRRGQQRIDRYCSVSSNMGGSWRDQRVSFSNWVSLHSSDGFINPVYIGDYDALTSDYLQQDGFFGSFEIQINGNPDVFGK